MRRNKRAHMDTTLKEKAVENDDTNKDPPDFECVDLEPGETGNFKSETGEATADAEWSPEESSASEESESDGVEFECEKCDRKFKSKVGLRLHSKKHSETKAEKSFQCEECDYRCDIKCKLTAHMMKHTGEKPYKCEKCEYRCAQKSRLKVHMASHSGERPFRCELCDVGYLNKRHLVRHVTTHHSEDDGIISGVYVEQGLLHRSQQDPKDPLNVDMCTLEGETTPVVHYVACISDTTQDRPRKRKLRVPCSCPNCVQGKISRDKKKQHNCHIPDCNKTYGKTSHLRAHLKTHTGERPHMCTWPLCGRGFTRSDELQRHLRTHTGEKRFKCPNCSKKFSRSDHLKKHVRTHMNGTSAEGLGSGMSQSAFEALHPFKCTICDYRSAEKWRFNHHVMTHTGERPFKCERCDYRCPYRYLLKVHMEAHTRESPFRCALCDVGCLSKGHLLRHIRTHTERSPVVSVPYVQLDSQKDVSNDQITSQQDSSYQNLSALQNDIETTRYLPVSSNEDDINEATTSTLVISDTSSNEEEIMITVTTPNVEHDPLAC